MEIASLFTHIHCSRDSITGDPALSGYTGFRWLHSVHTPTRSTDLTSGIALAEKLAIVRLARAADSSIFLNIISNYEAKALTPPPGFQLPYRVRLPRRERWQSKRAAA